jgi:alpha-tubulin suppressor-like RCC1 family protein
MLTYSKSLLRDCCQLPFYLRSVWALGRVIMLVFVMQICCLAAMAQTQLDSAGKVFCSGSAVFTQKKGQLIAASAPKLIATNKKNIKLQQTKLKRASKRDKAKIRRTIAGLTQTNKNIDACINGDYEVPAVVQSPLSIGVYHNCAIRSDGQVVCWGDNGVGQLGDGTTTSASVPVNVRGLSKYSIAVSAGEVQSCAVSAAGGVKCWGRNLFGEVGNGNPSTYSVLTPEQVVGLSSGVKTVVSGRQHTCALTTSGTVKCWGRNSDGQLGTGSFSESSAVPVDVTGLPGRVTQLAAGDYFTCALLESGALMCWGYNAIRQLGDGSTTPSATPLTVVGVSGAVNIDAGASHACAVLSSGILMCWGQNGFGELGIGSGSIEQFPVVASAVGSSTLRVATGNFFSCGIQSSLGVLCWGFNSFGALGDGTFETKPTPTAVSGLSGVQSIAAGEGHVCAILSDRSVACWGYNSVGQLGNGNTREQSIARVIQGLTLAS